MKEPEPIYGEDYYFNEEGLMVFTEVFLVKRGYCCKSACRHCPYKDSCEDASPEEMKDEIDETRSK